MTENENPALPAILRVFSVIVIVVLLLGAGLFFIPEVAKVRWPWKLTPFNARFLGSFYLAEMAAMLALLYWNRWSPARMILAMAFTFTLVVTAMSALHLDQFNFVRKSPWIWFVVYIGSALITGAFLWRGRDTPAVPAVASAAGWRSSWRVEAIVLVLYGLAMILVPKLSAAFWPWRTDVFHAQIYSAIFMAGGAGTWLLARNAPREELVALGAAQSVLGVLAIAGLIFTDAAVKRIDWSSGGTYVWLLVFALIGLTGLNKLRVAMAAGPSQRQ